MSRRHAPVNSRQQTANSRTQKNGPSAARLSSGPRRFPAVCCLLFAVCCSDFHITDIHRAQRFHKLRRFVVLKFWIVSLDHQEEFIARSQRKVRCIEHRVVRLRQLIQRQHAEHSRKRGHQYCALKCNRNEGGPTVERLAANIQWIVDNFHPVLHEKPTQPTEYSDNQHNQRQTRSREPNRLGKFFNWIRRITIYAPVTFLVSSPRCCD